MATAGEKRRTKTGTTSHRKSPPSVAVGSRGATAAVGQKRTVVELPRLERRSATGSVGSITKSGQQRRGAVTPEERRKMIAEAAYLKAERRGFEGGSPGQDWVEAEAEIDAILMRVQGKGAD